MHIFHLFGNRFNIKLILTIQQHILYGMRDHTQISHYHQTQ